MAGPRRWDGTARRTRGRAAARIDGQSRADGPVRADGPDPAGGSAGPGGPAADRVVAAGAESSGVIVVVVPTRVPRRHAQLIFLPAVDPTQGYGRQREKVDSRWEKLRRSPRGGPAVATAAYRGRMRVLLVALTR
ncbi:hypothetical protein GCM10027605_35400 [Micromonospora zhanjiangensis]